MRSIRTALLVACFGIAMFHEAKAANPSANVVLVPEVCQVPGGTVTWAYEDYVGVLTNAGGGVVTSSVSTPINIIVFHCFASQAACQASQTSAAKPAQQNFTLNLGASANGSMHVGRIALGCHAEGN